MLPFPSPDQDDGGSNVCPVEGGQLHRRSPLASSGCRPRATGPNSAGGASFNTSLTGSAARLAAAHLPEPHLSRVLKIVAAGLLLAGCAPEGFAIWDLYRDSAYVYLTDKRFEPKPPDYPIDLLDAPPVDGRYVLLAHVQVRKKAQGRFDAVTPDEVLELLKDQTRKIGGDAIYNVRYDPNPDGVYRITNLRARATAIVLIKSRPIQPAETRPGP